MLLGLGLIILIIVIIAIWKIVVKPVSSTNKKVKRSERVHVTYGPLNVELQEPKRAKKK